MKAIFGLGALIFVGVTGWQLGGRLSSDAIGMALGILFGVMAGIPASLMVLAARRRDQDDEFEQPRRNRQQQLAPPYGQYAQGQFAQQPPVIVVTGQGAPMQQGGYGQQAGYGQPSGYGQQGGYDQGFPPGQMAIEGPAPQREFRVVGEVEEVLEPW